MSELGNATSSGLFGRLCSVMLAHRIACSRVWLATFLVLMATTASMHEGQVLSGALLLLGVILVGIATVGRVWCLLYISGYKDVQLVTSGPYSICRNPLYFFSLLGMAGVGFATETVTLGLLFPTVFLAGYVGVVRREEEKLRGQFGPHFDSYCRSTPRFMPHLASLSEPSTYEVSPRLFRRSLGDVVWFVWCVGLVQLVVTLHERGILPAVWRLP